jgi:hypothetical protein
VKTFLIILACLGLALVLLAAVPASFITLDFLRSPVAFGYHLDSFGIKFPYFWGFYPAMLGAMLVLAGGLIARPRFLWIPMVAVGVLHILSFTGLYVYAFRATGLESNPFMLILSTVAPGLLCVVVGLVVRKSAAQQRRAA